MPARGLAFAWAVDLPTLLSIAATLISLASLAFVLWKTRRRVTVTAHNTRVFQARQDLGTSLSVTAINDGYRRITITGFSLEFSDGSSLSVGDTYVEDSDGLFGLAKLTTDSDSLPKSLDDGDHAQVFFEYERILQHLLKVGEDVALTEIFAYDIANHKHKARVPKYVREKVNGLREVQRSSP